MTPDQIIEQIWDLPWYSVMKVAFYDDLILFVKIYPIFLIIIFFFGTLYLWEIALDD